tara:strand:+ start:290 stop:1054 length:765 start_codon:yes stop_codon:yes gene_type:complete
MLSLKQGLGLNTIKTSAAGFDNLYSLDFDGVDDYLHLGNGDALTPNSSGANRGFSISFWINSSVKSQQVFSKNIGGDSEYECILRYNGNLKLYLYSSDTTSIYQSLNINTDIADGNWHHIVFAWELGSTSTSIQGYLDGVNLRGGTTYASSGTWVSVSNTAADLRLAYQGGSYGEIMLDEFAIFDDNLTLPQVTEIYNSGVPNDLSSIDYLVGWWRMGDPDGTSSYPTITDQSSNSNDGTMTNMASGDIVTDVP